MNSKEKFCPLLLLANAIAGCVQPTCPRDECAWWNDRTGQCSIAVMGEGGDALAEAVFSTGSVRVR